MHRPIVSYSGTDSESEDQFGSGQEEKTSKVNYCVFTKKEEISCESLKIQNTVCVKPRAIVVRKFHADREVSPKWIVRWHVIRQSGRPLQQIEAEKLLNESWNFSTTIVRDCGIHDNQTIHVSRVCYQDSPTTRENRIAVCISRNKDI